MNITLYYVNNLKDFAVKFLFKMYEKSHRITLICDDETLLNEIDDALWTFKQVSFIPHLLSDHPLAKDTPIVLSSLPFQNTNASDMVVLLNDKSNIECDNVVKAFDNQASYEEEKKRFKTANCWIYKNDTWEKDTEKDDATIKKGGA